MSENHTYPEEAFRAWETRRRKFESTLAGALREIKTKYGISDNSRALDLACGEGQGSVLLELGRHSVENIVGLDIDDQALSEDRWLSQDEVPRVKASAFDLPFKDASFDMTLSLSGLHTIEDEKGQLELEAFRVTVPGGTLIAVNDTPRYSNEVCGGAWGLGHGGVVPGFDSRMNISVPVEVDQALFRKLTTERLDQLGVTEEQLKWSWMNPDQRVGADDPESVFSVVFAEIAEACAIRKMNDRNYIESFTARMYNDTYTAGFDVFEEKMIIEEADSNPIQLNIPGLPTLYPRITARDDIGTVRYFDVSAEPWPEGSCIVRTNVYALVGLKPL
jgi:SAM-dependent methyltransferase